MAPLASLTESEVYTAVLQVVHHGLITGWEGFRISGSYSGARGCTSEQSKTGWEEALSEREGEEERSRDERAGASRAHETNQRHSKKEGESSSGAHLQGMHEMACARGPG